MTAQLTAQIGVTCVVATAGFPVLGNFLVLPGPFSGPIALGPVELRAESTNAGIVFVGGATTIGVLGTRGFPLAAGERMIIPVFNPSEILIFGSIVGQKVRAIWVGHTP